MNNTRYVKFERKSSLTYPTGFVIPVSVDIRTGGWGDAYESLGPLYDSVFKRTTEKLTMDMVNETIKLALELFKVGSCAKSMRRSHILNVFRLNHVNGGLVGKYREFVIDTLGYIATGHRTISISTWASLFRAQGKPYHEPLTGVIKEPSIVDAVDILSRCCYETDGCILSRWVAQDGGMEDMLYTLYMLFTEIRYERAV
jgi:hypothetical protein